MDIQKESIEQIEAKRKQAQSIAGKGLKKFFFEKRKKKNKDGTIEEKDSRFVVALKSPFLTAKAIYEALNKAYYNSEQGLEELVARDSVVTNYGNIKQKYKLGKIDVAVLPEEVKEACKKYKVPVIVKQSEVDGEYTVFFNPDKEKKLQKVIKELTKNRLNLEKPDLSKTEIFKNLEKTLSKNSIRNKTPAREAR